MALNENYQDQDDPWLRAEEFIAACVEEKKVRHILKREGKSWWYIRAVISWMEDLK